MGDGRFVKGQSGNPGGRKAMPADVRETLYSSAPEMIDRLIEWARDDNRPDALRLDCMKTLLDRAWGKPAQSMSVDASVGATVSTVQMSPDEMLQAIKEAAKAVSASDGDKPGDTQSG